MYEKKKRIKTKPMKISPFQSESERREFVRRSARNTVIYKNLDIVF